MQKGQFLQRINEALSSNYTRLMNHPGLRSGHVQYATAALPPASDAKMCCGQAALVNATALSLEELGVTRDDRKYPLSNVSFADINNMLSSQKGSLASCFALAKTGRANTSVQVGVPLSSLDALLAHTGVYFVYCWTLQREDMEYVDGSTIRQRKVQCIEAIGHYVVVNADLGVVYTQPEVRAFAHCTNPEHQRALVP